MTEPAQLTLDVPLSATLPPLDWPPAVREFLVVADAVSKLNAWTKSAHCGFDWSSRYVIYWLKGLAIKRANRLGLASHRRILVKVKCRDCGGTGKYEDSYGHQHNHCRACFNTGTAKLEFIETSIADYLKWHTPLRNAWEIVPGYSSMEAKEITEWQPNQQSDVVLEPDEAARLLNIVEAELTPTERYRKRMLYECGDYYGETDDFANYSLWIGETPKGACVLCESHGEMTPYGRGVSFGRLQWTAHTCTACDAELKDEIWPRLKQKLPEDLMTANIKEWAIRHKSDKMRLHDLVVGHTYLTPFDPGGRVGLIEIEAAPDVALLYQTDRITARVRYLEDHPHGYEIGSTGRYLAKELRYIHEHL